jgi:clan AA aspartic protease (TIGR02281 family)
MHRRLMLSIIFVVSLIVGDGALADEAIPFTERHGLKYVTVSMNGVPMDLVFDTGSTNVALNSDGLLRIGIKQFDDTRKVQSHTAGGVSEGYIIKVNSIRVGTIQHKDYDILYLPSSTANLLGASFFTGYSYYIDEDHKVIRLMPKGSYFFDRFEPPAVDREKTGSGRIEVEIDDEKYIFDRGTLRLQGQDTPNAEIPR